MYHSITYGEKNTWDDWHLIPSSRPVFNPPATKTQYVDLPGGNGQIDLTEALTGYPVYENRTGSHEFYVENGYKEWSDLYSEIMNYLHGKSMEAYLEDDPYYVYVGRFEVNEWKSDKWNSVITIDYNVYPYKKERNSSLDDWLWDPFDFENGVIREYKSLSVSGSLTLKIPPTVEPISPTIIVSNASGEFKVAIKGKTYILQNGTNYLPDVTISTEEINMVFTGTATVSVDLRGGKL